MANAAISDRDLRRVVIASLIGATMEWHDFFLYGTVAGIVFNRLFFPVQDPLISILLAYTTFAVGFVARPRWSNLTSHERRRPSRPPSPRPTVCPSPLDSRPWGSSHAPPTRARLRQNAARI